MDAVGSADAQGNELEAETEDFRQDEVEDQKSDDQGREG
jgi:hypothetical protein